MAFHWDRHKSRILPPLKVTIVALGLLIFVGLQSGDLSFSIFRFQGQPAGTIPIEVAFDASEGAIFFSYGNQLIALPLGGKPTDVQIIQLPQEPSFIVPTPGGVSVFVGFSGVSELLVYSTQDFTLQAQIPLDISDPEAMSFSPTGEQAFIFWEQGQKVTEFSHSRLSLTPVGTRNLEPGESRLISNRRGSRFFRAESQGLRVHLAQQLLEVELWNGQITYPVFDPGYTEIWGVNQDGFVSVIDERTGQNLRRFQHLVSLQPGVVTDRVSFLSADGTTLIQYQARRSTEPRIVALPEPVHFLTRGSGQSLIALSESGAMFQISQQGQVEQIPIPGLSQVQLVTTAIVRQDGSFACF